jgi:hypothetical protein
MHATPVRAQDDHRNADAGPQADRGHLQPEDARQEGVAGMALQLKQPQHIVFIILIDNNMFFGVTYEILYGRWLEIQRASWLNYAWCTAFSMKA